jgi:hypothetical protein
VNAGGRQQQRDARSDEPEEEDHHRGKHQQARASNAKIFLRVTLDIRAP